MNIAERILHKLGYTKDDLLGLVCAAGAIFAIGYGLLIAWLES